MGTLSQQTAADKYGATRHQIRKWYDLLKQEWANNDAVEISMTQTGSPYDNALAERINRTIKDDYHPGKKYQSHNEAVIMMDRIIDSYNHRRPHQSINYLTPNQAHEIEGTIVKRWKTFPRKPKTNVDS